MLFFLALFSSLSFVLVELSFSLGCFSLLFSLSQRAPCNSCLTGIAPNQRIEQERRLLFSSFLSLSLSLFFSFTIGARLPIFLSRGEKETCRIRTEEVN